MPKKYNINAEGQGQSAGKELDISPDKFNNMPSPNNFAGANTGNDARQPNPDDIADQDDSLNNDKDLDEDEQTSDLEDTIDKDGQPSEDDRDGPDDSDSIDDDVDKDDPDKVDDDLEDQNDDETDEDDADNDSDSSDDNSNPKPMDENSDNGSDDDNQNKGGKSKQSGQQNDQREGVAPNPTSSGQNTEGGSSGESLTSSGGIKSKILGFIPGVGTASSISNMVKNTGSDLDQNLDDAKNKATEVVKETIKDQVKAAIWSLFLTLLPYILAFLLIMAIFAAVVQNSDSTRAIMCNSANSATEQTALGNAVSGDKEANAKTVYKFLMENVKGATPSGVCAYLGNAEVESGVTFNVVEGHASFDESKASTNVSNYALGISQWDGARRANLIKYAKDKGKKWSDPDLQLDYLIHGDTGKTDQIIGYLTSKDDIDTITENIRAHWEVGGTGTTALRQAHAKVWYANLNGMSVDTSKATVTSGSNNLGTTTTAGLNTSENSCLDMSSTGTGGTVNGALKKAYDWAMARVKKHSDTYSMAGARDGSDNSFDCSGFVYTALKNGGYTNLSIGNTVSLLNQTKGTSSEVGNPADPIFKQVDLNTAKAGTIVVTGGKGGAGAAGHVFFLADDYKGGETRVLECTFGTVQGENGNSTNPGKNGPAWGNTYQYAAVDGHAVAIVPINDPK